MATVHDLIQHYRPELELEKPLTADEALEYLKEQTDLEEETIRKTLQAVNGMLFWHLVRGRPVELEGVGTIRPTIDLDGTIRAALDVDAGLVESMSEPDAYRAGINRRENIGISLQRMAQMWNSTHPDDPVRDVDAYALVSKASD
jgi:hypothetical protein